jgi:uncharacterized protein
MENNINFIFKPIDDDELKTRLSKLSNKEKGRLMLYNYNNKDRIRLLLDNGVDINVKNEDGFTTLMYASVYGYIDVCRVLLDAGADVDMKNNDGKTSLMLAVGFEDIVEVLLDNGANVNIKDRYGRTALMIASMNKSTSIDKLLKYSVKTS